MQDIIKKIIEVNKTAQKMIDDTNAYKDEVEKSIEADKKAMRDKYIERARHRIAVTAETEDKFLGEALGVINQRFDQQQKSLESNYTENRQAWVEELYQRVVGR